MTTQLSSPTGPESMSLLSPDNLAGQTLLRLVSSGAAIIAELNRLAENIPTALLPGSRDRQYENFAPILFGIRYLKDPDAYNQKINEDTALMDLDMKLQSSCEDILKRFYYLFESIYQYYHNFDKYLKDLDEGFFVQVNLSTVLLDNDGKQLLCEGIALFGTMLLFLDSKIPGRTREFMLTTHYRWIGEGNLVPLASMARLLQDTGFVKGEKSPPRYPVDYFGRFPINRVTISKLIDRLSSDDIYHMTKIYPDPAHRCAALSQQAGLVYVLLYFIPSVLDNESYKMREIIDKHFSNNWVIPVYMGYLVDLSSEWKPFKAAYDALSNTTLQLKAIKQWATEHGKAMMAARGKIKSFFAEGQLTEDQVIDEISEMFATIRQANISLKWIILHQRTFYRKGLDVIRKTLSFPQQTSLEVLIEIAHLEFSLKGQIRQFIASRIERWKSLRENTEEMMLELAHHFSGEASLSRVDQSVELQEWFEGLAKKIAALDHEDVRYTGYMTQKILEALDSVEKFGEIETSTHIQEFLKLARDQLHMMVRLLNIDPKADVILETISDISYLWDIIPEYIPTMHQRIRHRPDTVVQLRAVFIKLTSALDIPLVRISAIETDDTFSVAEFYSGQLIKFVRKVMGVIPHIVFDLLQGIIRLQTRKMVSVQPKFEAKDLTQIAQFAQRHEIASRTHRISIFTEGIMAMEETLLGVIKTDPKQILHDGIRAYLVERLVTGFDQTFDFDIKTLSKSDLKERIETRLKSLSQELEGFRKSFEYIQDYIDIYGLKLWQEEFTRVINFYAEQESNRYVAHNILPSESIHQSVAIPIRHIVSPDKHSANFMGRVVNALIALTDYNKVLFSQTAGGWFETSGREVAGKGLFMSLRSAMDVPGLCGIDKVVSFMCGSRLRTAFKKCAEEMSEVQPGLAHLLSNIQSSTSIREGIKLHRALIKRFDKSLYAFRAIVQQTGQLQLLRRQICHELQFAARLNSNLLYDSVITLNDAIMSDIRKHYRDQAKHPYPPRGNLLLPELAKYLTSIGLSDPYKKIYTTTDPLPYLGVWLALLVESVLPKLCWDDDFSTLVKIKQTSSMDGMPLVVGVVTVLRQVHPSITRQFFQTLSHFALSALLEAFGGKKVVSSTCHETINAILFVRMFLQVSGMSQSSLETYFPSYLYSCIQLRASA